MSRVTLKQVREVVERWARYVDAELPRMQIDAAAMGIRDLLGMPVGCFGDDPLPDGPDPESDAAKEAARWQMLRVAYEVPSNDAVIRMHHRERTRERKAVVAQILSQIGGYRHFPEPMPKRIHYRMYRRQLIHDHDNLIGGVKMLQDAIESCGLIWEDSRMWLLASYEQQRANREMPWVEIEIWDYPSSVWTPEQERLVERAAAGEIKSGTEKRNKKRARQATVARAHKRIKRRTWNPEEFASQKLVNQRSARKARARRRKGASGAGED